MRLLCGISDPVESAQARDHLSHCGRCELFNDRLIAWREKAAMLPAPVAEGASPECWGGSRVLHGAVALAALKQHVRTEGRSSNNTRRLSYYRACRSDALAAARPARLPP